MPVRKTSLSIWKAPLVLLDRILNTLASKASQSKPLYQACLGVERCQTQPLTDSNLDIEVRAGLFSDFPLNI